MGTSVAWIDARKRHHLPHFIEYLYEKRFSKKWPDVVLTLEEAVQRTAQKKAGKREAKLQRRQAEAAGQQVSSPAPASLPESANSGNSAEGLFS